MEKEYKYTVCTRCFTYNHASYIVDAMNGFTMQETTFPVVTLIVDDASTDGEQEVILQYLKEYFEEPYRTEETEYAEIICAKHKTNKNCEFVVFFLKYNHYSIKKAKMPYLSEWRDNAKYHALCEGDDYWIAPDKLEKQIRFLEANPEYSMSHTNYSILREYQNKFIENELYNTRITEMNIDGKVKLESIIHGYTIQTATVVFRREFYTQMIMEDPFLYKKGNFMMGDTSLFFGLCTKGRIHYQDHITTVYRKHVGSATMQNSFKKNTRFMVSCWELNYYLASKYHLSKEEKKRAGMELGKYLTIYRLLDPQYKSVLMGVLPMPDAAENRYVLFIKEMMLFYKNIINIFLKR